MGIKGVQVHVPVIVFQNDLAKLNAQEQQLR